MNTANDPNNCGACDVRCSGATPYCGGTCTAPPCSIDAGACATSQTCCGTTCCGAGELCCDRQGPVSGPSICHRPTVQEPTCPQGCAPLCASDRSIKTDLAAIDERAILQQVATLRLSTWRYSADPSTVRHLGPMAQDFKAAFGLGDTDKGYHSIDAHGVSLASIKALFQLVQEQEQRLRRLEAENAALKATCGPR
ncbi:MAG: tail fiber domain-containing protein [Myxococcaceae bacterium]|nr:tail fiber domain-containing protein [Myxococcaceae bacterium]